MLPLSICCLLIATTPFAEHFVIATANNQQTDSRSPQKATALFFDGPESSRIARFPSYEIFEPLRRRKRYVVRKKRWTRNHLTWRLDTRNIKEQDEYVIRTTLHRAFNEWSSASSVRFEEVKEPSANIVIGFERGRHQDAFPFDGKDGVVAHAFYPRDGRLHFDADEEWSLNSAQGVNLFQTAVHEIGHLLGLEHSVDPRAVMFSARRPYDPDFSLGDDDVRAIRVLFPLSGEMKEDHPYESNKSGDGNREMVISQVVENLLGGFPTVTQPRVKNSAELIFPFPLPLTSNHNSGAFLL